MKLVIDCFKLVKGAGKSIGIYNLAQSIVKHLGERALREKANSEHEIIVLGNAYNKAEFRVPGIRFVEVDKDPADKLFCVWWELYLVRQCVKKYDADRVLFPRGYRPLCSKKGLGRNQRGDWIKDTIIIHDLIPFYYDKYYPEVFNKTENAYIMNRLKASIRGADRIITISDYSKEDILSKVRGAESRITVINNGLNDVSIGEAEVPDGLPQEYIVAMTSLLPHKNVQGVLKAYEAYYKRTENPLSLVVIGISDTSTYPEMNKEAASYVKCCKFFDSFAVLCRVVAGAKAYLFLSLVEGFGFPPLEAMQLGVPVVCSDRSSLPEVVADAGVLVDPEDIVAVAEALSFVTTDEKLRKKLVEKGYENVKRFSWESRTELYWKELLER